MNSKFVIGLTVTLGLTALAVSTLAQGQRGEGRQAGAGFGPSQSSEPQEDQTVSGHSVGRSLSRGAGGQSASADQDPFARVHDVTNLGAQSQGGGFAVGNQGGLFEFSSDSVSQPFVRWSRSPEENKLAQSAAKLAKLLGDAKSGSERDELKDQLNKVLESQFDLRQKHHADEISALEARVKKLRNLLERRQESRREIVAKRLEQISSEAQGLGW
jgi:hypothetical protein